jgi:hypothetical protein
VDMVTLAASFGISVTSQQFASEAELWRIIQSAIANGHGVVFPYACAGDDGAPASGSSMVKNKPSKLPK